MTPDKAVCPPVSTGLYSRALAGPGLAAVPGPVSTSAPPPHRAMRGPAWTAAADSAAVLRRRFPGLVFWFGSRTRSWWALVRIPAGWRLVEAVDAEELTRAVLAAATWPYPPVWQPVR